MIFLSPVLLANANEKSFSVSLLVTGEGKNVDKQFEMKALVDSGAGGIFLDKKFTLENKIALTPLDKPILVYNVDGTKNNEGTIKHCVWLKIQIGHVKINMRFLVTGLEQDRMILGLLWLKQYNPKINWKKGTMDVNTIESKPTIGRAMRKHIELAKMVVIELRSKTMMEEVFDYTDHLTKNQPLPEQGLILEEIKEEIDILRAYIDIDDEDDRDIWIKAKTSISQELSYNPENEKAKIELPEAYEEYRSVFEKGPSEQMPMQQQ